MSFLVLPRDLFESLFQQWLRCQLVRLLLLAQEAIQRSPVVEGQRVLQ